MKIVKFGVKSTNNFDELLRVISALRGPKGCPWDRSQTHQSLKPYLLEETYETLETIDQLGKKGGYKKFKAELGDLLLQVVLHAQLAAEKKRFTIADVIKNISRKMIRRHPHVFAGKKASTVEAVLGRWEQIKKREQADYSLLNSIPRELPALSRADKVQRRVARVGFDWGSLNGPLDKLDEEINELHKVLNLPMGKKRQNRAEDELGDILLSVVNIARRLEIDAEEALRRSTNKFIRRFNYIENTARRQKKHLSQMTLAEMDKLWERAKKK